ncbi:cysteine proteinase, partial [Coprinopsis marcescibilis]
VEKKVGLFVTKELSSAIETCRAKVERIAHECRAKNQKFRDQEFDLEDDASLCLGNEEDKWGMSLRDVQRVTEIYEEPIFFPSGGAIDSNAIAQGDIGTCYFLAALATVASIPGLIEKICVSRDEEVGVYGFIFYTNNGWESIIIDDLLYTRIPKFEELDESAKKIYHEDKEAYEAVARKGGRLLLFARSGSQQETWVPLIEKAYAKLNNNFAHLEGGFTTESVEELTGGVSSVFKCQDILNVDKFWNEELLLVNKDRVFAGAFRGLQAPEDSPWERSPTVQGLYGNHAYSVLRAVECKGKRFVIVRNPWGTGEWTGPWSDGSKEWTPEWLAILPELGHRFGDDGQFVMEYKDFLRSFQYIDRTFLFDDRWILASSWQDVPLSLEPCASSYGSLSFSVKIPSKTMTILALTRLNERAYRSLKKVARVRLEFAVVKQGDTAPLRTAVEVMSFTSRTLSIEMELDAGAYVVYVSM